VKTKKAFPIFLSFLAITSIASVAVLGNTQTAYAGGIASCGLDPEDVIVILAPNELSQVILKKIDCNAGILSVDIDAKDCENSGIDISFDNIFINPSLDWRGDETITNDDNAVPGDVICSISFGITSELGTIELPQIITITTPEPTVVGGELLPIDSTALVLAGLQTSAIWMLPILAGVAGSAFGILYIKSRRN